MQTYSIDSLSFFESIIHPVFADLVPAGVPFNGNLNEFTVMDNVVSKRPIIDIRSVQNIMQRRDASCDINYKKVMGATTRMITTDEIYGATQFCRNAFYQGCLKDFRAKDPIFATNILPFFLKAIYADVASNAYFGDIDRVAPVNAQWSTNIFDGVFKWIKKYITSGAIPAAQTITIADGTDYTATPSAAYALIQSMYNKQSVLMKSFVDGQKAFYVSTEIASGYEDYLIAAGITNGYITDAQTGIKTLAYKGIPILVESIWTPIITEIKGSAGYAAVLTLKGNFVFATDKTYGEGEDGNTALEVFYNEEKMTWFYRIFLKAGTQIALPEFIVVALTAFS